MIRAKKSLGQNFLSDRNILGRIAGTADLTKADTVVEIGPGTGNLTKILAEKAGRVIAIEKDHRLIEQLQQRFPEKRVQIIEGDVLALSPGELDLKAGEFKIVANIPYYITSHFIRNVFEKWPRPRVIVLTVQKEVAQRIIAQPPHMNLLALSVQFYANAEIIGTIARGSFTPSPKVDSAIVKIVPKTASQLVPPERFFKLIRAGFSSPRKQLINNLVPAFGNKERVTEAVGKVYSNERIRPENLSIAAWCELSNLLENS